MAEKLLSQIPEGPLAEKWTKHKAQIRVVSPANKRKLEIIVIGTGLGGAAAAALADASSHDAPASGQDPESAILFTCRLDRNPIPRKKKRNPAGHHNSGLDGRLHRCSYLLSGEPVFKY